MSNILVLTSCSLSFFKKSFSVYVYGFHAYMSMEDYYCRVEPEISCWDDDNTRGQIITSVTSEFQDQQMVSNMLHFEQSDFEIRGSDMSDFLKAQIASHPLYPNLLSAYIDCQKVGAPPEMASLFEEIGRENHSLTACAEIGADPELDNFMESYCRILQGYKDELSKPFDEASVFLSNIESRLSDLCGETLVRNTLDNYSDETAQVISEEEVSCYEVDAPQNSEYAVSVLDKDLKQRLMRKYSGYLNNLRQEFLKKRKKDKLPKDARVTLMEWWNAHYRWPYPTEEEKTQLSEMTGLNPKQINNWFINQRKRHWKPSENMRLEVREGVSSSPAESMYF